MLCNGTRKFMPTRPSPIRLGSPADTVAENTVDHHSSVKVASLYSRPLPEFTALTVVATTVGDTVQVPMYRFLVRPRWLLFHVLIVGAVVLMVNLAFWQLRRLDERKSFNALVTTNSESVPVPMNEVLTAGSESPSLEWRRVLVTGTYRSDLALTIVNRAQDGTAGTDSVVPLEVAPNSFVLVNRGFTPLSQSTNAPPSGTVEIVGYLRRSQKRGFGGSIDPSTGTVKELHRIDVSRIAQQIDGTVATMYVQRLESAPAEGEWPARVTMPKLDEGPHLSYAVQWFFFSLCALAGWAVVVRKQLVAHRELEKDSSN